MQHGEPQPRGEPVSGGAGGGIGQRVFRFHVAAGPAPTPEAGQLLGIDRAFSRLAGESATPFAQGFVDQRHQRVEQRRAVAGGPHHAVAARVLGIARVEAQDAARRAA